MFDDYNMWWQILEWCPNPTFEINHYQVTNVWIMITVGEVRTTNFNQFQEIIFFMLHAHGIPSP